MIPTLTIQKRDDGKFHLLYTLGADTISDAKEREIKIMVPHFEKVPFYSQVRDNQGLVLGRRMIQIMFDELVELGFEYHGHFHDEHLQDDKEIDPEGPKL